MSEREAVANAIYEADMAYDRDTLEPTWFDALADAAIVALDRVRAADVLQAVLDLQGAAARWGGCMANGNLSFCAQDSDQMDQARAALLKLTGADKEAG